MMTRTKPGASEAAIDPSGVLAHVIESIHLKRFKNFQDATLKLGPLTILIGANAAGDGARDAFLPAWHRKRLHAGGDFRGEICRRRAGVEWHSRRCA